ncbi:MAG TPA: hypothetical protein VN247_06440 [Arenimonas sp.]|nr:hypothetical protein [Arenimonas sp.]
MKKTLACFLFITFCNTAMAKKYVEPISDTASLRIVLLNPESYSMHIAEYDLTTCKRGADVGWISGGRKIDTTRIGMPGSEEPREGILERRIPANQPIAFGTRFIMPKQSILSSLMAATNPGGANATALADAQAAICEVPVFTAKPGELYSLHLQPLPQSCKSELYRIQVNTDGTLQHELLTVPRIRFPV